MRSKTMAVCAAVGASLFVLVSCNQQQASNEPAQTPPPAAETAPPPADQQADALSPAANEKYLADNAAMSGVTVTPSGLQYRVLKAGTGKSPKATDEVTVTYKGQLINGQVFDQTDPGQTAKFPTNALIPGWVEALQLMKEGDEWEITIPSKLGYGEAGAGGVIPPNQTLVFNMQLMKVN